MESELLLSWPLWSAVAAALFLAGVTQGALGFGFPTISTPALMLLTDVKTAIVLNLLPNFTVNLISVVRGGNWGASLGRYWPVAAWVLAGSWLGASFLILAPADPVRLLLAIMIIAISTSIGSRGWTGPGLPAARACPPPPSASPAVSSPAA